MHTAQRYMNYAFTALLLLLFTGCAQRPAKPDVLMVPDMSDSQIVRLMNYVNNVLDLPPAAQSAAQENLRQQFKLTQFPEDRMRLALLDTLLPEPGRNEDQAVELLSGYNWGGVGPGFNGLASLVLNFAKSQQTNAANNRTLSQQLSAARSQKDHLQQQLDALKSIEKTMNKRDKSIVTPPVPILPSSASTSTPATAAPLNQAFL